MADRLLQDPRIDPSDQENKAILWASNDGHLNVLNRLLLDERVDPSAQENQAIRSASSGGHGEATATR